MFSKAAVFTDLHFGLKNNSKIHNQDCEDYIDWFIATAKEYMCDTVVFCGDWNHNRNSININTLNYNIKNLEKLSHNFKDVYVLLGNHDLYYRDRRDVQSIEFFKFLKNVYVIDKPIIEDDIALVPWLIDNEWKTIKKLKSRYVFGHFEIPSFLMNAMVRMPDHGELNQEDFKKFEYVFSGHFHKRQIVNNIHYIGNAFPHNFSDAWDDQRGMMIFEREKQPIYINWTECPKYKNTTLSRVLNETDRIVTPKTYLRIEIDLPISYEETNFIKETFIEKYKCREISLMPKIKNDDYSSDLEIKKFESVDEIVSKEIQAIDSKSFNQKLLMDIYQGL